MVKSVTPIAGFDPEAVHTATIAQPQPPFDPGTRITADNGRDYIYAKASAAISADTQSTLTEPAMTMAGGAGDWDSPPVDMASGTFGWFKARSV